MKYGFSTTSGLPFQQTISKVTEELQKEGFGVLTTIDVKETMKKKLGVDFQNYIILGACNPPHAYQALQAEEEIGLLLPCNVIVYEKEGIIHVSAFDPMMISQISGNSVLTSIAQQVKEKLTRVIEAV